MSKKGLGKAKAGLTIHLGKNNNAKRHKNNKKANGDQWTYQKPTNIVGYGVA